MSGAEQGAAALVSGRENSNGDQEIISDSRVPVVEGSLPSIFEVTAFATNTQKQWSTKPAELYRYG